MHVCANSLLPHRLPESMVHMLKRLSGRAAQLRLHICPAWIFRIVWVQGQLPDDGRRYQPAMAPTMSVLAVVLLSCGVAAVRAMADMRRLTDACTCFGGELAGSCKYQSFAFGLRHYNACFLDVHRRSSRSQTSRP